MFLHKSEHFFGSFGAPPEKFELKQLPKPINFPIFKIQDLNGKLYGTN